MSELTILPDNVLIKWIGAFHNNIRALLMYSEFSKELISHPISQFITYSMVYGAIILAIYEAILNLGVYLSIWKHPADEVFKEIPVHCAHCYVNTNILLLENGKENFDGNVTINDLKNSKNAKNGKLMLRYPLVYHIEFSPDEYAHEEFGTTVGFLRGKVYQWFLDSQVYFLNKEKIGVVSLENVELYTKKGKVLGADKDNVYLCDANVGTGDVVYCVIKVDK